MPPFVLTRCTIRGDPCLSCTSWRTTNRAPPTAAYHARLRGHLWNYRQAHAVTSITVPVPSTPSMPHLRRRPTASPPRWPLHLLSEAQERSQDGSQASHGLGNRSSPRPPAGYLAPTHRPAPHRSIRTRRATGG